MLGLHLVQHGLPLVNCQRPRLLLLRQFPQQTFLKSVTYFAFPSWKRFFVSRMIAFSIRVRCQSVGSVSPVSKYLYTNSKSLCIPVKIASRCCDVTHSTRDYDEECSRKLALFKIEVSLGDHRLDCL